MEEINDNYEFWEKLQEMVLELSQWVSTDTSGYTGPIERSIKAWIDMKSSEESIQIIKR